MFLIQQLMENNKSDTCPVHAMSHTSHMQCNSHSLLTLSKQLWRKLSNSIGSLKKDLWSGFALTKFYIAEKSRNTGHNKQHNSIITKKENATFALSQTLFM